MLNQSIDFCDGYDAALEEVKHRLTSGDGRTESYEDTLKWIDEVLHGTF